MREPRKERGSTPIRNSFDYDNAYATKGDLAILKITLTGEIKESESRLRAEMKESEFNLNKKIDSVDAKVDLLQKMMEAQGKMIETQGKMMEGQRMEFRIIFSALLTGVIGAIAKYLFF